MAPGEGQPRIGELIERALAAHGRLADLGEQVEDEWQYVADLRAVYRGRLTAVATELAAASPAFAVTVPLVTSIDTVVEEAGLVSDPHRAIDWLSTLPQVVLLALGADT